MKHTAQVTLETMAGFGIFLLLFAVVVSLTAAQTNFLSTQSQEFTKKDSCLLIAQALYDAKNNQVTWMGHVDYNTYISSNTVYMEYVAGVPFTGIYCQTIDTNMQKTIVAGDVNISYTKGTGFIITP